jgi:hypothetical protein
MIVERILPESAAQITEVTTQFQALLSGLGHYPYHCFDHLINSRNNSCHCLFCHQKEKIAFISNSGSKFIYSVSYVLYLKFT